MAAASTLGMWAPCTSRGMIGMRTTASTLLNANDLRNRIHIAPDSERMSAKTRYSSSRKLPMIVTSLAMIAAET